MVEQYKRLVLWNCRFLARIPGYKHYGRFMLRCYTKNFWLTWWLNMATSVVGYFGMKYAARRLMQWSQQQQDQQYLEDGFSSYKIPNTK